MQNSYYFFLESLMLSEALPDEHRYRAVARRVTGVLWAALDSKVMLDTLPN